MKTCLNCGKHIQNLNGNRHHCYTCDPPKKKIKPREPTPIALTPDQAKKLETGDLVHRLPEGLRNQVFGILKEYFDL